MSRKKNRFVIEVEVKTMDQFLDFVADVMNVDVSDISPDIVYKEYKKWDSLMMLNLIMEIEEEYGVRIPLEIIGNIKTLQDLYDLTLN